MSQPVKTPRTELAVTAEASEAVGHVVGIQRCAVGGGEDEDVRRPCRACDQSERVLLRSVAPQDLNKRCG